VAALENVGGHLEVSVLAAKMSGTGQHHLSVLLSLRQSSHIWLGVRLRTKENIFRKFPEYMPPTPVLAAKIVFFFCFLGVFALFF
jgi:hypothetical protein